MTPETLEALKGSIEKWRKIVEENGEDRGHTDCPLCQLFWYFPKDCKGCPVRERTGNHNCIGTPYEDWSEVTDVDSPEAKAAARAELDFLRSLLPQEEGE